MNRRGRSETLRDRRPIVVPYLRETVVHVQEIQLERQPADVAVHESRKRMPLRAEHVDVLPSALVHGRATRQWPKARPAAPVTRQREEIDVVEEEEPAR